jgi:hypothetical protein
MCRKLTLDFGTDAKHKQKFIWHKASRIVRIEHEKIKQIENMDAVTITDKWTH